MNHNWIFCSIWDSSEDRQARVIFVVHCLSVEIFLLTLSWSKILHCFQCFVLSLTEIVCVKGRHCLHHVALLVLKFSQLSLDDFFYLTSESRIVAFYIKSVILLYSIYKFCSTSLLQLNDNGLMFNEIQNKVKSPRFLLVNQQY